MSDEYQDLLDDYNAAIKEKQHWEDEAARWEALFDEQVKEIRALEDKVEDLEGRLTQANQEMDDLTAQHSDALEEATGAGARDLRGSFYDDVVRRGVCTAEDWLRQNEFYDR